MKYEFKVEKYKADAHWSDPDPVDGRVTWAVARKVEQVFEAAANELGAQGWNLVAVWPAQEGIMATYSREIPENAQMQRKNGLKELPPKKAHTCDCLPGTKNCGRKDCTEPYACRPGYCAGTYCTGCGCQSTEAK